MSVKWQDPPIVKPGRHGGSKWKVATDELRERPGVWALIGESESSAVAFNINHGKIKGIEAGEFEATCRNTVGSKADIYARYVGAASA